MKTITTLLVCLLVAVGGANAQIIDSNSLIPLSGSNFVSSGNGTLDMLFYTESNASNDNGVFDGSVTDMVTGQNKTSSVSYVTTMGEIANFYQMNFPGMDVDSIQVMIDLNQTGSNPYLFLDDFKVVINYDQLYGDLRDNPGSGDIDSATQNLTGSNFSGGQTLAYLDSQVQLDIQQQGAGWADYALILEVDPFSYAQDTPVLFYWQSSGHNDGGETIFLSGSYQQTPEPATIAMISAGGMLALVRGRRKSVK